MYTTNYRLSGRRRVTQVDVLLTYLHKYNLRYVIYDTPVTVFVYKCDYFRFNKTIKNNENEKQSAKCLFNDVAASDLCRNKSRQL